MKVKLVFDVTSSGHLRLTCRKCGHAFVRQPYMRSMSEWIDEIIKEHGCIGTEDDTVLESISNRELAEVLEAIKNAFIKAKEER